MAAKLLIYFASVIKQAAIKGLVHLTAFCCYFYLRDTLPGTTLNHPQR
jgi:hypothetical protein